MCGKRITTDSFISRAKSIHGDKYDYTETKYTSYAIPVEIICKIHGKFEQLGNSHLNGRGCFICGGKTPITKEVFENKSNLKHNNEYLYDNVKISGVSNTVLITCKIHGDFKQRPRDHMDGQGCPKCKRDKFIIRKTDTPEQFIDKCKKIHNSYYSYSKVNYTNGNDLIIITCPIHGDFTQKASVHLGKCGCKKCTLGNRCANKEEFIEYANKIHGHIYDYSKVIFTKIKTNVTIICEKHGEFSQNASTHLYGSGCPLCNCINSISLSEIKLLKIIKESYPNYEIIQQYQPEWLGKQKIDLYVKDLNIAIEYQGEQHFKPIEYFGGDKSFQKTLNLDENKRVLCEKNGVILKYFSFNLKTVPKNYGFVVYNNIEEMFNPD